MAEAGFQSNPKPDKPRKINVRFADDATEAVVHKALSVAGIEPPKVDVAVSKFAAIMAPEPVVPMAPVVLVSVPEGEDIDETVAKLNADPAVLWASPQVFAGIPERYDDPALAPKPVPEAPKSGGSSVASLSADGGIQTTIPNDPMFSQLWGFEQANEVDVDATDAWDIAQGDASIIIAVIDTGIDYNHPEFVGRMWDDPLGVHTHGYDFINNDGNPMDDHFHGTHCAGTIGAKADNNVGVCGINWFSKLMAVKCLSEAGNGSDTQIANAIHYAVDKGAKIISCSLGGMESSPLYVEAIQYAKAAGVLFVVAAGNNGANLDSVPFWPACVPEDNVLVVSNIKQDGSLHFTSNYSFTQSDIAAPGTDIVSTMTGGGYATLTGTSMATPLVAGICGLVKGQHPDWTYLQVKQQVMDTAKQFPALTGKCITEGIASAWAAVFGEGELPPRPPGQPAPPTALGTSGSTIQVSWQDVRYETGYRVERSTNGTVWNLATNGTVGADVVTFTDTGLAANTIYYYRVTAFNTVGESEPSSLTSTQTLETGAPPPQPPATPSGLTATATSASGITLGWSDVANETGYHVYRSPNGTSGWILLATGPVNAIGYNDTGLTANTPYYYRIDAFNAVGPSAVSATVTATTLAGEVTPTAPNTPTALSAVGASEATMTVTWTGVADETGYYLDRSLTGTSGWTRIVTLAANVSTYTDSGLTASTQYFYRIAAFNAVGPSAFSGAASGTTQASTGGTAPDTPTGVSATPVSSTEILIDWTDVANETGYYVFQIANGAYNLIATTGANISAFSHTGLTPSTVYYYGVSAFNAVGGSSLSDPVSGQTLATGGTVPIVPTGLAATAASPTSISLTWTDVTGENGYRIQRSANGTTGWAEIATPAANTVSYTNSGLTASTQYFYRIAAFNATGASAYSAAVNATTPAVTGPQVPATPTGLAAVGASASSMTVTWNDVTGEDSYKLERSLTGNTWSQVATPAANAVSHTDSGLAADTLYYYKISAINATGASPVSGLATGRTLAATAPPTPAPPTPSGLTAQGTASPSITITWTNVAGEDGYYLDRSANGTTGWTRLITLAANVTSYTDSGLQPTTAYFYRISAFNASGVSSVSGVISGTTLAGAAPITETPDPLTAVVEAGGVVRLSWNNVADATSYRIERSVSGTGGWDSIRNLRPGDLTYRDANVSVGTTYDYRARSISVRSATSSIVTVTV